MCAYIESGPQGLQATPEALEAGALKADARDGLALPPLHGPPGPTHVSYIY